MRHSLLTPATLLSSIVFATHAFAGAPMSLVPIAPSIQIRSDGSGVVNYLLTSTISQVLTQITIDPSYGGGNGHSMYLQSNTCSTTLNPLSSCNFQVVINGINQATNFTLSPRVCAYNGLTCVVAPDTDGYRPAVSVAPVTHPVTAYLAMISGTNRNSLQPINVATQTLGTPIPGFSFETPPAFSALDASSMTPAPFNIGISIAPNGETVYVPNPGNAEISIVNVNQNPASVTSFSIGAGLMATSELTRPGLELNNTLVSFDNQTLYATAYDDNHLYVINIPSRTLIQSVVMGILSHSETETEQCRAPATLNTNTLAKTIPALSPDGSAVYAIVDTSLFIVNTSNYSVASFSCPGLTTPNGIAVAPDNSAVYVTDGTNNTVSVFTTANRELARTINVGTKPAGIAISPNGNTLYVVNSTSTSLSVIDVPSSTVTNTINLPGAQPYGVSISPDGTTLYVSDQTNNFTTVINTSTFQVTTINVNGDQSSFGGFVG